MAVPNPTPALAYPGHPLRSVPHPPSFSLCAKVGVLNRGGGGRVLPEPHPAPLIITGDMVAATTGAGGCVLTFSGRTHAAPKCVGPGHLRPVFPG